MAVQSTLAEPADAVEVREGEVVHTGEVLAVLDTADLQAQLRSDLATANSNHANTAHTVYQGGLSIAQGMDALRADQAAVSQAQQTLKNDTLNLQRDQGLLAQGYVSQQAVDTQTTLVRNDQQAVNTANSNLSAARSNVQANGSLSGRAWNRRRYNNPPRKNKWRSRKPIRFACRLPKRPSFRRSTAS